MAKFSSSGSLAIGAATATAAAAAATAWWWSSSRRQKEEDGKLLVLPRRMLREAAEAAADAFSSSPVYVMIAGENLDRVKDLLTFMFYRNFWLRLGTRCNRAMLQDGRLIAFFMLVPPEVPDVGLFQMIMAGILRMPLIFGKDVVDRLLKTMAFFDEEDAKLRATYPDVELCHLERVCVLPAFQGKGVGSKALRAALDETDAKGQGVFLATQLDRNVTFYSRLGFELVKSIPLPPHLIEQSPPSSQQNLKQVLNHYMVRLPPPSVNK